MADINIPITLPNEVVLETHEVVRVMPNPRGVSITVKSWLTQAGKLRGAKPYFPEGKTILVPGALFRNIVTQLNDTATQFLVDNPSLLGGMFPSLGASNRAFPLPVVSEPEPEEEEPAKVDAPVKEVILPEAPKESEPLVVEAPVGRGPAFWAGVGAAGAGLATALYNILKS